EHGNAREAPRPDQADRLLGGGVVGQGGHVDERHHDLAHGGIAEVEDLVDHLGLGDGHVGLLRLHLEQEFELLARDKLARARPAPADEAEGFPHDGIGGPGEGRQDRAGELEQAEQAQDEGGRPLACDRLRDDLAEHQEDGREPERNQQRSQVAGDRHQRPRGQRRGGDVRDGHSHHGRGQRPLRLLERLEVPRGGAVARLREGAEAHAVGPDEGHLGPGEEGGHRDGEEDQPDVDHAAAPDGLVSRSVTNTSSTRVRSTFSTETVTPSASFFSPLWGTRPNKSSTQPPTVSNDSLGTSSWAAVFSSSIDSLPETRNVRASTRWIRRSSSSNSSRISPTSSSRRSSSVTSPAVPPYSSTTMARW